MYGISYSSEYPNADLIDKAKELACGRLPDPALTDDRYGVGFIGVHEGSGANFVFIDWWANENELHHHVYVANHEDPENFVYVTPTGLNACCWDLRVIGFERDCWVATVLNHPTGMPNLEQYLHMRLNEKV